MADSQTTRVPEPDEALEVTQNGVGSEDRPDPPGPAPGPRRKLILHIDLNNTILVSDAVTGQGTLAALDGFLSTVTWGKMNQKGINNTASACVMGGLHVIRGVSRCGTCPPEYYICFLKVFNNLIGLSKYTCVVFNSVLQ